VVMITFDLLLLMITDSEDFNLYNLYLLTPPLF
jgi:hypothetical protein